MGDRLFDDPGTRELLTVLTVQQPWASLLISGRKDIENRSWNTRHRGLLVIHAAKRIDRDAPSELFEMIGDFPLGALVGSVTVEDVVLDSPSIWARPGSFHWVLGESSMIEPVPMSGKVSLWSLPEQYRHLFV